MSNIIYLTIISSFRFFGLFIVLPIIGLYTDEFQTSAFLAGLAAGGYALTQIIFQTPFGIWSDKYNRKHIIGIGLFIFLVGSLVCAFSNDISMLIIGRFLQGAGAIGGVISAQIADLVIEEKRNKAMAIMGAGIFISFILAMICSPLVASNFGLNSIFFIIAFLCGICLALLYLKVPDAPLVEYQYKDSTISNVLKDKNMLIMYLSSFLQKFLMIFAFVCISLSLKNDFHINEQDFWQIYLPAALIGIFTMGPSSVFAQKKGRFKGVMLCGIVAFMLSYIFIALSISCDSFLLFIIGVLVFFGGFAMHEPIIQSLASRYPKAHQKGSALGIFTTLGYAGSALGGILGGFLYQSIGLYHLAIIIAIVCIIWGILLVIFLSNPANQKNIYLDSRQYNVESFKALQNLQGIIEYYLNKTQQTIIIKYDHTLISESSVLDAIKSFKIN